MGRNGGGVRSRKCRGRTKPSRQRTYTYDGMLKDDLCMTCHTAIWNVLSRMAYAVRSYCRTLARCHHRDGRVTYGWRLS